MTEFPRSACPIASTLDLFGDKWSLVIVRDLINGKSRFGEFLDSPEGIPTNILTDRLRRLERTGVIVRTPYQERPARYAYNLTDKGRALHPLLREICRWGNAFLPGTWVPPKSFMKA